MIFVYGDCGFNLCFWISVHDAVSHQLQSLGRFRMGYDALKDSTIFISNIDISFLLTFFHSLYGRASFSYGQYLRPLNCEWGAFMGMLHFLQEYSLSSLPPFLRCRLFLAGPLLLLKLLMWHPMRRSFS